MRLQKKRLRRSGWAPENVEAGREAGKSKEELAWVGENTQHCWKWKAARVRLGQGSERHREHKGGADGWRKSVESEKGEQRTEKPRAPGSEEGSGEEGKSVRSPHDDGVLPLGSCLPGCCGF